VRRVVDVPLCEVSGICSCRSANGRSLIAVGEAEAKIAWSSLSRRAACAPAPLAIPISQIDITGLYALRDLRERLEARGASLILAGRKAEFLEWFRETGLYRPEHETWVLPTLRQALKAYLRSAQPVAPLNQDDL
jgi:hypothetical protein